MRFSKILFSCLVLLLLMTNVAQAQIVGGGAGIIKTAANPNTIPSIQAVDQRFSGSIAYDTLARIVYQYEHNLAVGSRWKSLASLNTDVSVTNFRVSGGNIMLDSINLLTGATLGTMSIPVINIAPVQSVVGTSPIVVTNAAGVYTVALPVVSADNPVHAGTLGVAMNSWFYASMVNTMGMPPGTIVRRLF